MRSEKGVKNAVSFRVTLQTMAPGYDTSMLLFPAEMGNILTCASNNVKIINA